MKMGEMVSIVVPVYNAGKYIEETIRMVQGQTFQDWELILVDDCSKDDSIDKIKPFLSDRIRLIPKERNEGAAEARNTGLDNMRGRYLAFLDADDVWRKEKLEKELAFMKEKDCAFCFTAYEFGDEEAKGTGKIVKVPETLGFKQALPRTVIFTTTVLFDTAKIDKRLLRMPNVPSEDTATWWQILKAGYTAYGLNENLAIYRRPAKSLSSNKFVAVKRIWYLYRRQVGLSVLQSVYYFVIWAFLAVRRRI